MYSYKTNLMANIRVFVNLEKRNLKYSLKTVFDMLEVSLEISIKLNLKKKIILFKNLIKICKIPYKK